MTLAELGESYAKEYRARVAAEKKIKEQQAELDALRREVQARKLADDVADARLQEMKRLRGLILSFVKSLCTCTHMGDVGNEIGDVLDAIGQPIQFHEQHELYMALDALGVKTLRGY